MKTSARLSSLGVALLHDPTLNKGTAFTEKERDVLGLRGLLPPKIHTQQEQIARVLESIRALGSDLDRYVFLRELQDRNETLFYRLVLDHVDEMMPILYTPTVGRACQRFGHIFRRPRGIFISLRDRGRVGDILRNWPERDVRVIVVTDGERILGLGDLGADGMGIPIGKLALYTVCAGIHPSLCLPVTIDVGTNNQDLLDDPLYIGLPQKRVTGDVYDSLIDEFVTEVQEYFPFALIQFEDFANHNAFRLLAKYREQVCCFNDDIQGTAAVTVAGILSALRITQGQLAEQRFLFFGAGEACVGIGDLLVRALMGEGLTEPEARARCWFFDSKGLVVKQRTDLVEHKVRVAHEGKFTNELTQAIDWIRPTALIGASGRPGTFTEPLLRQMAKINKRPIVFALSNPTSQAECTAEEAYQFTGGTAVFASGSPFPPVTFQGRRITPGQGNNAYVFPGIGLGVVASRSRRVTDDIFLAAARALHREVSEADLDEGRVYPSLSRIREVSLSLAVASAEVAFGQGLALGAPPTDLRSYIEEMVYKPVYPAYV